MIDRLPFLARLPSLHKLALLPAAIALGLGAASLVAQMEGERGVPPIASSGDFEAGGIKVDVYAATPEAARTAGWKLAQRLAWRKLWAATNGGAAPALSDGQLDQIVSGVEIESEQIGPNRYIASLRILFDRARAGQILGVTGQMVRSPPLLVLPVLWQGGSATSFETINEWQKAWARYRTIDSAIDYVRTSGSGVDAVLLNYGQTGRRGRNWWRNLLDQYGAADVVIPIARLERQYPGGPVIGRFAARYGPDNALIGTFSLRVANEAAVPKMMDDAVIRINQLYTQALMEGRLRPDSSLVIEEPLNAAALPLENAFRLDTLDVPDQADTDGEATTASYTVQFDTPDVASVSQRESLVRSIPGVNSAAASSLALGGTSVMQVSFTGSFDALKTGLQARGFSVSGSGTNLRISMRQSAPSADGDQ